MKTGLTIAGSDSSGGAGIQADLKTFSALGVYGMSVITALTAQNTLGVHNIHTVPAGFVADQINAVISDIPPNAIKIGMLCNTGIVDALVNCLSPSAITNIVLDPVMISTSGTPLIQDTAIERIISDLLPLATLITPNTDELLKIAEVLGIKNTSTLSTKEEVLSLSKTVYDALPPRQNGDQAAVLAKGGHLTGPTSEDLLIHDYECHWHSTPRFATSNTHGTGCTLSAAIAAELAKGATLENAVKSAKHYLQKTLQFRLDIGEGNGPLNHMVG